MATFRAPKKPSMPKPPKKPRGSASIAIHARYHQKVNEWVKACNQKKADYANALKAIDRAKADHAKLSKKTESLSGLISSVKNGAYTTVTYVNKRRRVSINRKRTSGRRTLIDKRHKANFSGIRRKKTTRKKAAPKRRMKVSYRRRAA